MMFKTLLLSNSFEVFLVKLIQNIYNNALVSFYELFFKKKEKLYDIPLVFQLSAQTLTGEIFKVIVAAASSKILNELQNSLCQIRNTSLKN